MVLLFQKINEHYHLVRTHITPVQRGTKGRVILERIFVYSGVISANEASSCVAQSLTKERRSDAKLLRFVFFFQSNTFPRTVHTKTIKSVQRFLSENAGIWKPCPE